MPLSCSACERTLASRRASAAQAALAVPPFLRSRKIIAAMHIPAGVRHVIVEFAVGSVGEPIRIVTSSGLVLPEQHLELRGVKIAINRVESRLIGRVTVTQAGVMVIKI